MESTYGNRTHNAPPDYVTELAGVIDRTLRRGGNLVIPAFAVGRTQEMLYFIRDIKERKLIDFDFPVYVDSPLAIEATTIFGKNVQSCFDEDAMALIRQGINPIRFPNLRLAISSEDSKAINFDPTPKVIISASGMCEAGRVKHHLKHNLWRPEETRTDSVPDLFGLARIGAAGLAGQYAAQFDSGLQLYCHFKQPFDNGSPKKIVD